MSILHLSDTHGLHRQLPDLPDADVIVHSGDFTMAGTEHEAMDFINWFCDLPYPYKIFIAGNHDACLFGADITGLDNNCHYLCHSGIYIDDVNFYGVPMFMEDDISGEYSKQIAAIPNDTDVLITHQPPFGLLDYDGHRHYGSIEMLHKIDSIQPKLHLFGHIHTAYGTISEGDTTFSNASLVDEKYQFPIHGMYQKCHLKGV